MAEDVKVSAAGVVCKGSTGADEVVLLPDLVVVSVPCGGVQDESSSTAAKTSRTRRVLCFMGRSFDFLPVGLCGLLGFVIARKIVPLPTHGVRQVLLLDVVVGKIVGVEIG